MGLRGLSIGSEAAASQAGKCAVGMHHIAIEVPTLRELDEIRTRLASVGALVGASDHGANKSLYARGPDGLEFEVMWLVPTEHWGDSENAAIVDPLDLDAEIERFAKVGLR